MFGGRCYNPCFADEKSEAQSCGRKSSPRALPGMEMGFEPSSLDCTVGALAVPAALVGKLLTPLIYLNNNYRIQLVCKIFDIKDKNSVPAAVSQSHSPHASAYPTLLAHPGQCPLGDSRERRRGQWPQPCLACPAILLQVSC